MLWVYMVCNVQVGVQIIVVWTQAYMLLLEPTHEFDYGIILLLDPKP